jgi:hypothetical protein
MVGVKHTVHSFKIIAVNIAAENLIIYTAVQRIFSRQFFDFIKPEKANPLSVP